MAKTLYYIFATLVLLLFAVVMMAVVAPISIGVLAVLYVWYIIKYTFNLIVYYTDCLWLIASMLPQGKAEELTKILNARSLPWSARNT